jgi:hypothetical protein
VKPMMFVLGDGYILEASDVYCADGHNNDAKIIKDIFDKSPDIEK